ncbi:hypothetical protein FA15DRAFT_384107 [Coprinopsis marcescibilis]|uniref:Uncharacterized protein n=1 Tax=Coprinopsis marcescibilis TaxID=230819 RepID=A0A5C3KXH5_COPMA|nr:hypothetical protein FA15DRAFT_384107 [Coprinopsis marcescibilis]
MLATLKPNLRLLKASRNVSNKKATVGRNATSNSFPSMTERILLKCRPSKMRSRSSSQKLKRHRDPRSTSNRTWRPNKLHWMKQHERYKCLNRRGFPVLTFVQVEAKQSSHDNFKDRAQKMIRDLQGQKVALTKEKNELEAKISELQASGEESKKPDPALASLREERDKLLAEKASWSAAQAAPSDASGNWEAEKVELVRARDEALNNLKVAQDAAQKAAEEARNIRMQNVCGFRQIQTFLSDPQFRRSSRRGL